VQREVSLACVPAARLGDQLLVHVGFALGVVEDTTADDTTCDDATPEDATPEDVTADDVTAAAPDDATDDPPDAPAQGPAGVGR